MHSGYVHSGSVHAGHVSGALHDRCCGGLVVVWWWCLVEVLVAVVGVRWCSVGGRYVSEGRERHVDGLGFRQSRPVGARLS